MSITVLPVMQRDLLEYAQSDFALVGHYIVHQSFSVPTHFTYITSGMEVPFPASLVIDATEAAEAHFNVSKSGFV